MIKREILTEITTWLHQEKILILKGARQVGKTYLLQTIKKDLEKSGIKGEAKPFIFCLGEGMFIKGVDEFLIGKDIGKYEIQLKPEDAFGKRDPKLIEMLPIKVFIQHEINPIPGVMLNFDGRIAKI